MTIAEMYERVHLFVEHTVGEQPLMGELNPLIDVIAIFGCQIID